jgi:L-arabinonolactonase
MDGWIGALQSTSRLSNRCGASQPPDRPTTPNPQVPDGSCVDAAGNLWNAEFFSGRLVRYHPDGSVAAVYKAPTASRLTCPCIGGPSMKTVFVTSASVGLPDGHKEKGAGGIWAVRVDDETPGLPEPRFRG